MIQQDTEIKKLSRFITSLNPPNHIILLYDNPLEIETLKDEAEAKEYSEAEAPGTKQDEKSLATGVASPLYVRRGENQLSDMEGLLVEEREIDERGQENSIICAYNIDNFMDIGEEQRIEILSLHDHILFTRFTRGRMVLTEATENALNNSLGAHGADIVQRYIEQERRDREVTPICLRGYLDAMSGLLGSGTEPLSRLIYRRLFQTMRSSRECE